MNARGVIVEATASFQITWQRVGGEIKWDQTHQKIELHDADVYPDLEYSEASARATYVKYVSAARLNDLLAAINARIDELLGKSGKTEEPTQVKTEEPQALLPAGDSTKLLPPHQDDQVNENDSNKGQDFTVIVYGKQLRFLEGQRNTTTASAEILFKVSTNLLPHSGAGSPDNTHKIWAEVKVGATTHKFEYADFEEDVTKFGGNLIVQVLPSIEMKLKAKEDVYAYGDEESTEIKVTKAVRGDLEKLDDVKLKEIEDTILRIRNDRTAKKAKEIEAINQSANK